MLDKVKKIQDGIKQCLVCYRDIRILKEPGLTMIPGRLPGTSEYVCRDCAQKSDEWCEVIDNIFFKQTNRKK